MPRRFAPVGIAAAAALIAAGCVNFNVTKQVTPDGASTGPFQVHIDCQDTVPASTPSDEAPSDGQPEQSGSVESEAADLTPDVTTQDFDDLTFNGPGTQLSEDFDEDSTCIITEPVTAGALRVTFSCTGVSPPELVAIVTCTNIPNGLQVVIGDVGGPGDEVLIDVLVVNDFTVDPAVAVVAAPAFTG